jgi:hypothetical protein
MAASKGNSLNEGMRPVDFMGCANAGMAHISHAAIATRSARHGWTRFRLEMNIRNERRIGKSCMMALSMGGENNQGRENG